MLYNFDIYYELSKVDIVAGFVMRLFSKLQFDQWDI